MTEHITTTEFVCRKFKLETSDKKVAKLPAIKKQTHQITVTRTEQIHIPFNEHISHLCHIAKNLYNQALYDIRQVYFHNLKNPTDKQRIPTYNNLAGKYKKTENYKQLYSSTAQSVLKVLDRSWKSYWEGIKEFKIHPSKFTGRPRIPGYKKKDGEFILIFTNQACVIGRDKEHNNWLLFPDKSDIDKVQTRLDWNTDLREVRIIPQSGKGGYNIEIIYDKQIEQPIMDKSRIIGIDYGLRNIVAIANNVGEKCIVVKGSVAKSINQWYDKRRSQLYSIYDRQPIACRLSDRRLIYNKYGSKLQKTTVHRNRIMKDIMHKISRFIINWCVEHNIGTIVIGHNDMWKQQINLGRKTNLHFVTIPYYILTKQLEYKGQEVGIDILTPNEAHTSKCSFLDNESIEHHETYTGRRKGGLFKSARGFVVNADVHAGANIIRSVFPNASWKLDADGIVGTLTCPLRLSIKDLLNKKVSS